MTEWKRIHHTYSMFYEEEGKFYNAVCLMGSDKDGNFKSEVIITPLIVGVEQ